MGAAGRALEGRSVATHLASRIVELEDGTGVGVLIGHEQPLARLIELEVTGLAAGGVERGSV